MLNHWQRSFKSLLSFIKNTPDIQIEENLTIIPQNFNEEFYKLFNEVRESFIKEKFEDELDKARVLSQKLNSVKKNVIGLLALKNINLGENIENFIHDPKYVLMSGIYNPLFDLVKGKSGYDVFTQKAETVIDSTFKELYTRGYDLWIALSLIKLFEADRICEVGFTTLDIVRAISREETGDTIPWKGEMPRIEASASLIFKYPIDPSYIVPDYVIFSKRTNSYVAVRTKRVLEHIQMSVENPTINRAKLNFDPVKAEYKKRAWQPGLMIYISDTPSEIILVADTNDIYRPDLIIETVCPNTLGNNKYIDNILWQDDLMKPKLGTFVVSSEPLSKTAYSKLTKHLNRKVLTQTPKRSALKSRPLKSSYAKEEEPQQDIIRIMDVGFDSRKLKSIIGVIQK